jgi:hypothetical protein
MDNRPRDIGIWVQHGVKDCTHRITKLLKDIEGMGKGI